MPWKETCAMEERAKFIADWLYGEETMTDLCASFGVSRKTGYKWLGRFRSEGERGLADRSRRPHRSGRMIDGDLAAAILELRLCHPTWGPKKLRGRLMLDAPQVGWPAASTIGDLLKRHDLAGTRRRRRGTPAYGVPLTPGVEPNDVWGADFKGWFKTGNGARCEPVTVSDLASRYLLRCENVRRPDSEHLRPIFEAAFREYGLPRAIRMDNGPPFASRGVGGLTPLSVWWLKLGIRPERIDPGRPDQNGRHERLHRTLRHETACPAAATLAGQQRRFDRFRFEYNFVRPHEALGQRPPAAVYAPSPRPYPERLLEPVYGDDQPVRRVSSRGTIMWRQHRIYVGTALVGEPVALVELATGDWLVRFFDLDLGIIDHTTLTLRTPVRKTRKPLRRRRRPVDLMDNAPALPTIPQPQQPQPET